MSVKTTVDVAQHAPARVIPVYVVVPKPKEFIRGGSAALVNILCTFPINKVMFRQQLTGSGILSVGKDLYHEGIHYLYRGVGPPIMQKTICTSLMFGTFDFYRRGLLYIRRRHIDATSEETILIRLIASCCSGLTEALLTPFERVQTLMQIPSYNSQFKNFFSAFRQMGVREMYTGLSAIAMRNCLGSGLFLFFREPFQKLLPHRENGGIVNLLSDFFNGAVLGACISTLSFPFSVAKVQMQKNMVHQPGLSAFRAIGNVIIERGSVIGLYNGAGVNFMRALLSWGIVNAVYEKFGRLFPADRKSVV